MNYLLDTCVISELARRQPNPQVVGWVDNVDEQSLYLSVITIGEVRKGIEKLTDLQRKATLEKWLNDELLARFAGRILPIEVDTMLRWGTLTGQLEMQGKVMPAIDSLIAATALEGDLILVTRNESDFRFAEVLVLDPWK